MHDIVRNEDFDNTFFIFKLLSWPVGTWPLEKHTKFARTRTYTALFILIVLHTLLYTEMYQGNTDANDNLEIFMLLGCTGIGMAKTFCLHFYAENLVRNFVAAVKDYESIDNERRRTIVRKHAGLGKFFSYFLIFFASVGTTVFSFLPSLEKKGDDLNSTALQYPFTSEFIMSHFIITPAIYVFVCIVEYAILLVGATTNLGSDSLFLGITFHLCGQVEVLNMDFANYFTGNRKEREQLNMLIVRHQYLLVLADLLIETMNIAFIFQLFVSCLSICLTGIQILLSLKNNNYFVIWRGIMVLGTFFSQLFAYCYVGDYLTSKTRNIGFSAYSIVWYELPTDLVRNVIFTIARTQQPVYFTAGNLIPLNMETYMSIIKTSMSYLSVLRIMLLDT